MWDYIKKVFFEVQEVKIIYHIFLDSLKKMKTPKTTNQKVMDRRLDIL
jgi:hypothetical protein